jgi:hypothetical protein
MICNNFFLLTFFHMLPNNRVLLWPHATLRIFEVLASPSRLFTLFIRGHQKLTSTNWKFESERAKIVTLLYISSQNDKQIKISKYTINVIRYRSMFFFSCGSTVLLDPGRMTYTRFLELFIFSSYGRTHWTSDQPVARPQPTQDNTTQKYEDKHPCLKRD